MSILVATSLSIFQTISFSNDISMYNNVVVQLFLMILSVNYSVCTSGDSFAEMECIPNGTHPDSTIYGLAVLDEHRDEASVIVYYKGCAELTTVGPTWYFLEAIGHQNNSFLTPKVRSGAVLKENGIEFNATEEPLALLDLPRKFKWIITSLDEKTCFRLTIFHEESCQQVVSVNCTMEDSDSVEFKRSADDETRGPLEQAQHIIDCHKRYNCPQSQGANTVCGSDGEFYNSRCALRLHRCIHDIETLQRDPTGISCNKTINRVTTNDTKPCIEYAKRFEDKPEYVAPKCDNNGLFKPVQCWAEDEGTTCYCFSPLQGSHIVDHVNHSNKWIVDCNGNSTTSIPITHCEI